MSKPTERPPLRIRPRASARLAVFLLLAHGVALGVIAGLPLDWSWRLVLVGAVVLGLAHACAGHLLYWLPWVPREAVWQSDGRWTLTLVSGREVEPRLLASSYVSASLVVLNFRCRRPPLCSLVLLPDSLDREPLRRLRARLRLQRIADSAQPESGP